MSFTNEELKAAKATRDALMTGEYPPDLKSIYMAGEIVMWDEKLQDIRNKLTPFKNLIAIIERYSMFENISPEIDELFFQEIDQCKKNIEYLANTGG